MAQNFWGAIVAWTACRELAWHQHPAVLAGVVLTLTVALNILFW